MKIERAVSAFLISLENIQLSKQTIKAYNQDLKQFMNVVEEDKLEDIGFETFERYFSYLHKLQLKTNTLKRKRVVLHRFLKFCYQKQLCIQNLHDFIDPIRSKKTSIPKEILTPEEIALLKQYLTKEKEEYKEKISISPYWEYLYYCTIRNELLIHLLLYTGCRAHEAVSVENHFIHLDKKTITFLGKGQKYNQVPIHDELLSAFFIYNQEVKHLSDAFYKEHLNGKFLFPSKSNPDECLSTRALHDLMIKLGKVLNRHLHAHLFRHTFASYCIAANMDITTLSSLIAHSNPSITLSIYTHEIEAVNKQEQIKKLDFHL